MADLDRSEINRALAKAIAYKQCGKHADAADWAKKLVNLLECHEILNNGYLTTGERLQFNEGYRN
jgi:hypothetical protein